MKKTTITRLSIILGFCILTLAGCNQKVAPLKTATQNITEDMSCKDAIQKFLAQSDPQGEEQKVQKGDNTSVYYIGRIGEDEVFDTNIEIIAKTCETFHPQKVYGSGLEFVVGAKGMIAGFDKGVQEMNLHQTKTIQIPAKEAYGERSETNLITVPKEQVENNDNYEIGMNITDPRGNSFKIHEITTGNLILDVNPPLAGKDLIFDILVDKIKTTK